MLRLAAAGLTTAEIARRLVISPKTADSHIQHIYAKIGCSTRGAAVLFALRHNLAANRDAALLRSLEGRAGVRGSNASRICGIPMIRAASAGR